MSIVSSPFLASSKSPEAPHLLEDKMIIPPKRKKSQKKQVVINIINGPGSNRTFNFDQIINNSKESNRKMGIEGILEPMNELLNGRNRLGSFVNRMRRSIDFNNTETKDTKIKVSNNEDAVTEKEEETRKVNGTGRNNLNEDDYNYIYFSPPESFQNILNVNTVDYEDAEDYDIYSDQLSNPEAVDPSQLLIGFGGSRSTTRAPFFNVQQIKTNQHLGTKSEDDIFQTNSHKIKKEPFSQSQQQNNNVFDLGNIESSDQEIQFGDFSNLINLNKNTLKASKVTKTSQPSVNERESYNTNPTLSAARPSLQMIIRPSSSSSSSATSPIRQNNYIPPM